MRLGLEVVAAACSAGLLVSGCARYVAAPIAAADEAAAFRARSLQDAGLGDFVTSNLSEDDAPWPPAVWNFDTLTLAALYYHPDLALARSAVEIADAGRIRAGERPNPSFDTVPQYDTTSRGIPAWIIGSALNVPLETAGKRGYRIAGARRLAEAARWEVATAAWRVRRRLRAALLELYDATRSERLLQQQAELQGQLVALLEKSHAAGAVAGTLVMRERISWDRQRLALETARERSAVARVALAAAIGVPAEAVHDLRVRFNEFAHVPQGVPLQEARTRALLNRPDVLASLASYAASESALQLEIAKQYPDLKLGPGYEFDQGDNKWTLGLSITLPIFNRNRGAIAEARAHRSQAAARFRRLQAQVIGQVEQAQARFEAAREGARLADELVQRLGRQQQVTDARHRAGELAADAVLRSRLELVAGRLAAQAATVRLQRAVGQLEDAMQTRMKLSPGILQLGPVADRESR